MSFARHKERHTSPRSGARAPVFSSIRHGPIKLTNWKRAIEDPVPWLVLLVRFERGIAHEMVLVHIGKTPIERVIAKLCTLPSRAKTQLHRKTLPISSSDGAAPKRPDERSLLSAVIQAIGGDAFEYAKTSQRCYENAGYQDKSALAVEIALGPFKPDELYGRLARAAVGLEGLEFPRVSVRERDLEEQSSAAFLAE